MVTPRSYHDAGANFATIDLFKKLADEEKLPVRLYVMVRGESNARMDSLLDTYRMQEYGHGYLTVHSIKRQIDGALGSNGAWLLEPYVDLPRSTGLALEQPESVQRAAEIAMKHGFQVNTHAIGDRANRETLGRTRSTMPTRASRRRSLAPSPSESLPTSRCCRRTS